MTVSVDTMRAEVAQAAVEAGARLVNDVSGGLADPEMPRVVAASGVPYVVMHWRGHSHDMDSRAVYDDVVTEVREELAKRVDLRAGRGRRRGADRARPRAGLRQERRPQLDAARAASTELGELGYPLLIGASRKRFLGRLLADAGRHAAPFQPAVTTPPSP